MLSATSEYALRALSRLAQARGDPVLGRELAREANVPPQYLPKIMLMLRHAGLVAAARGTGGGYRLDREASQIHLLDVVEVFEGPLGEPACLMGANPKCTERNSCSAHTTWKRVREVYLQFLANTTIWDISAGRGGGEAFRQGNRAGGQQR